MKRVAILGTGISGLVLGYLLSREGLDVTLLEKSTRTGGVVHSERKSGFLAEYGPNVLLVTSQNIENLIQSLDLTDHCLIANPKADNRFLVYQNKVVQVPNNPWQFFRSELFSNAMKLALLKEPWQKKFLGEDESLADFVIRRLGSDFLDRLIDPIVNGIYAGDPKKLSVKYAFPKLSLVEQKYGSLIIGKIIKSFSGTNGEKSKLTAKKISFDNGLQVLIDRLTHKLTNKIKLATTVNRINYLNSKWLLDSQSIESEFAYDAIVYAGTAYDFKNTQIIDRNFSFLDKIEYSPIATVILGFNKEVLTHPLNGFGVLIPKQENFSILGTIFSSSIFPGRAPTNCVTLTSYLGGVRTPELVTNNESELIAIACNDLKRLFKINQPPIFSTSKKYIKAIPQYNLGHHAIIKEIDSFEEQNRGFFFAGSYLHGAGLADTINFAFKLKSKIINFLN